MSTNTIQVIKSIVSSHFELFRVDSQRFAMVWFISVHFTIFYRVLPYFTRFYRLPKIEPARGVWLQNIRKCQQVHEHEVNFYVCELHFESNQFQDIEKSNSKTLKKDAAPNIFPIHHQDHTYSISATSTQIVNELDPVLVETNHKTLLISVCINFYWFLFSWFPWTALN